MTINEKICRKYHEFNSDIKYYEKLLDNCDEKEASKIVVNVAKKSVKKGNSKWLINAINNCNDFSEAINILSKYELAEDIDIIESLFNETKNLESLISEKIGNNTCTISYIDSISHNDIENNILSLYANINNLFTEENEEKEFEYTLMGNETMKRYLYIQAKNNVNYEKNSYYFEQYEKYKTLFVNEKNEIKKEEYRKKTCDIEDIIVKANLLLVLKYAEGYDTNVEYEELCQEGNKGLLSAVRKYDITKGYTFSTYATWWIKQAINRYIAEYSKTYRIPNYMKLLINKIYEVRNKKVEETGIEPSNEEIANILNMTEQQVMEIKSYDIFTVSLYTPIGDKNDKFLVDCIPDDNNVIEQTIDILGAKQLIDKCLPILNKRDQDIIKMYYGISDSSEYFEPCTLNQISEKYNLSRVRISQIIRVALKKMELFLKRLENGNNNLAIKKENGKTQNYKNNIITLCKDLDIDESFLKYIISKYRYNKSFNDTITKYIDNKVLSLKEEKQLNNIKNRLLRKKESLYNEYKIVMHEINRILSIIRNDSIESLFSCSKDLLNSIVSKLDKNYKDIYYLLIGKNISVDNYYKVFELINYIKNELNTEKEKSIILSLKK